MSQIMKTFMGIFLIMFMVVISVGILSTFLTVISAQNTEASIISELEDSNFYSGVIDESFSRAAENGYSLSMTFYYSDNSSQVCNDSASYDKTKQIDTARVDLSFDLGTDFISEKKAHVLSGYAR